MSSGDSFLVIAHWEWIIDPLWLLIERGFYVNVGLPAVCQNMFLCTTKINMSAVRVAAVVLLFTFCWKALGFCLRMTSSLQSAIQLTEALVQKYKLQLLLNDSAVKTQAIIYTAIEWKNEKQELFRAVGDASTVYEGALEIEASLSGPYPCSKNRRGGVVRCQASLKTPCIWMLQ